MQHQDTVRVPLYARDGSVRAYTIIDGADVPLASAATWRLFIGHLGNRYAYRQMRVDGKRVILFLHRVLLGLGSGHDPEIDHANRDGLDNRRANLRLATHAANMQNRPSHRGSTSQYRGVRWHRRRRKWIATVKISGKETYIGQFDIEQEAADAARKARMRLMPYAVD